MKNRRKINNRFKCFIFLIGCCFTTITFSQKSEVPIWNKIPQSIKSSNYTEQFTYSDSGEIKGVRKVSNPTLTIFLADEKKSNGTSVVICPGGGYSHLSINKEGYKVAHWLNSLGITAFVLKYRLPSNEVMENKSIGPLQDVQEAIRIVRRNAHKWNIDPEKIGIMGFSAGGHLAATLSTHYKDKVYEAIDTVSAKPNFSILIYPVISMKNEITHAGSRENLLGKKPLKNSIKNYSNEEQVNEQTPPTFLIHATDDQAVPVENSINYFKALKENNVPVELHIYEEGGHGFGLGKEMPGQNWTEVCKNWLESRKYIERDSIYMFSYFKGNGEDGLHLAYSKNGYEWKTLKNDSSFLKPEVGKDKLMRDPCIIKGGDENYHMVWTVSWTDKGIGYASSKDLIHWSEQKFIPVMEAMENTRNTWAPEITYDSDSKTYLIYWASTVEGKFLETKSTEEKGYNHRMYYTTTKDFKIFTPTKLLYDPGFNVIDASILKNPKGGFIMFLKDETRNPPQKNIKIAYSDHLTGPYSKASQPITGDYWAEGPTAIELKDSWVVYFDKYIEKEYGAVTLDDLDEWTDISERIDFPAGARHGSIFKISAELFGRLKKE